MTPIFAAARMAGWTAHVREQYADNKVIRPASEYVGPRDRTYVPIDERSDPDGGRALDRPSAARRPRSRRPPIVYQVVQPTNGLATASLVLGILGIALFWFLGVHDVDPRDRVRRRGAQPRKAGAPGKGLAMAGLISGSSGCSCPSSVLAAFRTSSYDMRFGLI